jgi:hypothetical protein
MEMSSRFSGTTKHWAVIAAAVVATAIAIFAVLSLSNGSAVSPLAEAGERIEGQSMRMNFALNMPVPEEEHIQMDFKGELISNAEGTIGKLDGVYSFDKEIEEDVPAEMLIIGDDMWARFKAFKGLMPKGKPWVHMVDTTSAPETLTPREYARFLANADEVDEVDDDAPINGKPTTHYKGVVDVREMADEIGGDTEDRFEEMLAGNTLKIPVEAWIGRDGLPQRIKVTFEQMGKSMSMSADILEYGVPVDVKPPPKQRTIEEAEFDRLTATGESS